MANHGRRSHSDLWLALCNPDIARRLYFLPRTSCQTINRHRLLWRIDSAVSSRSKRPNSHRRRSFLYRARSVAARRSSFDCGHSRDITTQFAVVGLRCFPTRNCSVPIHYFRRARRDDDHLSQVRIFQAFQFNFTSEPFLPLVGVFGLIGLFSALNKRGLLLPLWTIIPMLVEPRSAPQYLALPLALLAGIGLVEILIPALAPNEQNNNPPAFSRMAGVIFLYLLIYGLISTFVTDSQPIGLTLKPKTSKLLNG